MSLAMICTISHSGMTEVIIRFTQLIRVLHPSLDLHGITPRHYKQIRACNTLCVLF